MQDSAWEMHIKSLAGALPIMLGDPRKLNAVEQKKYKAYSDWMHTMSARHDIMTCRQDLAGFGEPAEGSCDGFQRINTDTKSGGIAAVFRHGSKETSRTVTIDYLDNDKYYDVKEAIAGKIIQQHVTGKQLSHRGFTVTLKQEYAGMLMQIEENKRAIKAVK